MNPLLIGGAILGVIALSSFRSRAQGSPTDGGGGPLPTGGSGGGLPTGGSGGGMPTGGGGIPTGSGPTGGGAPAGGNLVGYYMGTPCMRDQLDYNLRLAKESTFWLPAQTAGCEVLALQVELNNFLSTPLLTDGIFGPATESALQSLLNVSSITLSQLGLANPNQSGGASGNW